MNVSSINATLSSVSREMSDIRKDVHRIDKSAVFKEEYNKDKAKQELLNKDFDKRIWKIVIAVTVISGSVSAAVNAAILNFIAP